MVFVSVNIMIIDDVDVKSLDLVSYNMEFNGDKFEYFKEKYYDGEISLQDFMLLEDDYINIFDDVFDLNNSSILVIDLYNFNRNLLFCQMIQVVESLGFFFVINYGICVDFIQCFRNYLC